MESTFGLSQPKVGLLETANPVQTDMHFSVSDLYTYIECQNRTETRQETN